MDIDWDEIKNFEDLIKCIDYIHHDYRMDDLVYLYAYYAYWDGYKQHTYDNPYEVPANKRNYNLGYDDGQGDRLAKKGT